LRKKFSQLQFRGIHDLVCGRPRGGSLCIDSSNKKIWRGDELKLNALAHGIHFRLNIGEPARGVEHANAFPNLIAPQRRAGLLWQQVKQVLAILWANSLDIHGLHKLAVIRWSSRRGHLLRICLQRQHRNAQQ
jgi:hypothetical protein